MEGVCHDGEVLYYEVGCCELNFEILFGACECVCGCLLYMFLGSEAKFSFYHAVWYCVASEIYLGT